MADTSQRVSKLAIVALLLAGGAVIAALVAGLGTGEGWWSFRDGLKVLRYLFFAAAAGALLGIVALVRRRGGTLVAIVAVVFGLGFSAYLLNHYRTAKSVPAIHDATTDLTNPPAFERIELRADNLENIPDNGDPALAALAPAERWKALHRTAYPDLRPVALGGVSVAQAIARAEALARDRGWLVVHSDRDKGILEATATTRFFRFHDDVVVRARPAAGGSLVDIRSVSRVGASDLGVNAERVREFAGALAGG